MEYSLKNAKSILIWLICLAYAGLFFPIRISNIFYSALIVFCALNVRPRGILEVIRHSPFAQIVLGTYALLIVGVLYSNDLQNGIFVLEKKLPFLLIPIFFLPAIHKLATDEHDLILRRLGYLTMLSSLVLLVIAAYRYLVLDYALAFTYIPGNQFEGFTSIHYVYYAMYFACGSIILIDSLFDDLLKRKSGLFLVALLFVYSLGIMVLVASKTGIISYILTCAVFLYHRLESKGIFIFLVSFILIFGCLFLYLNDTTRSRFEGLGQGLSILKEDDLRGEFEATGLNMRLLFWKIQVTNAWKDGYLFSGTGTGDIQHYIDMLYNLPKYQLYGYIGWDSHNQWVHTLLQIGLPGVILLAALYFVFFRKAVKFRDVKLLSFLIITFGFSHTESILELNKGIVFFSLFFALLTARYIKRHEAEKEVNA